MSGGRDGVSCDGGHMSGGRDGVSCDGGHMSSLGMVSAVMVAI